MASDEQRRFMIWIPGQPKKPDNQGLKPNTVSIRYILPPGILKTTTNMASAAQAIASLQLTDSEKVELQGFIEQEQVYPFIASENWEN